MDRSVNCLWIFSPVEFEPKVDGPEVYGQDFSVYLFAGKHEGYRRQCQRSSEVQIPQLGVVLIGVRNETIIYLIAQLAWQVQKGYCLRLPIS